MLRRDTPALQSDITEMLKKPFWTIHEAAYFTGFKVRTIYNKVSRKEMPYRKRGKRLFFIPNEIINWIDEGD